MKLIQFVTSLALGATASLAQNSAFLPETREFGVSVNYSYESYKKFWAGKARATLPDDIIIHSGSVFVEYGIAPSWAADLSLGYIRSEFSPAPTLDGLNDTRIGLRYQIVQEAEGSAKPTLAVRVGGIIEGTYDTVTTGAPNSPGDGASGFEVSLPGAKSLGDSGLSLFGELGYRHRAENVPDDLFGLVGLAWEFLPQWNLSFAYRHEQALSGLDIGGPGFNPTRFPELKEIQQLVEIGLGYTFQSGPSLNVFAARTIDGRNTGDKTVFGMGANFPF